MTWGGRTPLHTGGRLWHSSGIGTLSCSAGLATEVDTAHAGHSPSVCEVGVKLALPQGWSPSCFPDSQTTKGCSVSHLSGCRAPSQDDPQPRE